MILRSDFDCIAVVVGLVGGLNVNRRLPCYLLGEGENFAMNLGINMLL